jgi:hypothetical protein
MEPEKEAGAGWKPTPKTNRSHRGYAGCEHCSTRIELCPPGYVHYAKEICTDCDGVLRWIPKPETLHARRLNALRLAKLARCAGLSSWDRAFVRSVSQRKKVSPRQQALIDRLSASYLKEAA